MNKATLEVFLQQERERLIKFENYWKKNQKETPDIFPETLMLGDWDENYNIFDDE